MKFARPQILDVQDDVACGAARWPLRGRDVTSDHLPYDVGRAGRGDLGRADGLSIAQDGDAVAEAEDLVHFMRDVDDRDAAVLEVADEPEEAFDGVSE